MQKTINVKGDKIKIITRLKTSLGNKVGYTVFVNDKRYFFAVLNSQEAQDKGYVKYIKENR